MVLFWISAGLLTVAVVLALTRPLLAQQRRADDHQASEVATATAGNIADVAVYRDQLAEVETDHARGLISATEAEAARIEIARRLLAAADAQTTSAPAVSVGATSRFSLSRERMFTALACAVPALALGLYLMQGSPGMPGNPIAPRLAKAPTAAADIDELVARVEAKLRADPADGQGWDVIAPVYLKLERFREASEAYRRSIELLGETPRRLGGLAESVVLANDGIVTEDARRAYQRLLELDPERIEARFGLALALEQDGDLDSAQKAYNAILESSPPRAPWRSFVIERLDALAERRGTAPAGQGPPPDRSAADAVAGLPEEQRRAMILQMVESLSARLDANGNDLDGWQRLIRSWTVLGDKAKAEATLVRARKALGSDAKALSAINAFAKELGL